MEKDPAGFRGELDREREVVSPSLLEVFSQYQIIGNTVEILAFY